jgi:hypothetical protein
MHSFQPPRRETARNQAVHRSIMTTHSHVLANCFLSELIFIGSVSNCHPFSRRKCQKPSCAQIVGLLYRSSPAAISGLIVPVHIYSVNGFAGRAFSHVADKSRERIRPFFAHADSTSAIEWVLGIIRIVATTFGFRPRAIGPIVNRSVSSAVAFSAQASTAFNLSRFQIVGGRLSCGATITETSPPGTSDVRDQFDHCQHSETLTC